MQIRLFACTGEIDLAKIANTINLLRFTADWKAHETY